MNIWALLDIDETTDITAIKKAYAKQVALHHPEDCPEEFRQIHSAYLKALEFARRNKDDPRYKANLSSEASSEEGKASEQSAVKIEFTEDFIRRVHTYKGNQEEYNSFNISFDEILQQAEEQEQDVDCGQDIISVDVLNAFDFIAQDNKRQEAIEITLSVKLRRLPLVTAGTSTAGIIKCREMWFDFLMSPEFLIYFDMDNFVTLFMEYVRNSEEMTLNSLRVVTAYVAKMRTIFEQIDSDKYRLWLKELNLYRKPARRAGDKTYIIQLLFSACIMICAIIFSSTSGDNDGSEISGEASGSSYNSSSNFFGDNIGNSIGNVDFDSENRYIISALTQGLGDRYDHFSHVALADSQIYDGYILFEAFFDQSEMGEQPFDIEVPSVFITVREEDYNNQNREGYIDFLSKDEYMREVWTSLVAGANVDQNGQPVYSIYTSSIEERVEIPPSFVVLEYSPKDNIDVLYDTLAKIDNELDVLTLLPDHIKQLGIYIMLSPDSEVTVDEYPDFPAFIYYDIEQSNMVWASFDEYGKIK